jgi:hypothetical protein
MKARDCPRPYGTLLLSVVPCILKKSASVGDNLSEDAWIVRQAGFAASPRPRACSEDQTACLCSLLSRSDSILGRCLLLSLYSQG